VAPSDNPKSAIRDPQSSDSRALPALYRIAALAARTDDARVALREMLDLFIATFGADAGSIGLLSPDTGRLETEVEVGTAESSVRHEVKLGHGITGWCVLNRRSLLVSDVTFEPRYIAVRPSARCEMAAPIQDGDHVMGVIDLESDRVGGFSPADLALLETLASETARVMQRLWQVGHLKDKARQLESLITAGQSLVTKLEQQELFDTLTREARNMLQARACALYLHHIDQRTIRCASITNGSLTPPPAGELPLNSVTRIPRIARSSLRPHLALGAGDANAVRRRGARRGFDLHRSDSSL
jgi:putative methionine-R-sulfoxide reductase with GAF domain